MPTRDHPHDKLFKQALGNPKDAALELKAVLPPALTANIDFESLAPQPDTFLDDSIKGSYASSKARHDALPVKERGRDQLRRGGSGNRRNAFAVVADGSLYCWGGSPLGDGSERDRTTRWRQPS